MIYADLHSHTLLTDGMLTPEQLVDAAAEAGIKVFALTDHDSTEGLARTREQCRKRGLEWVPGVEISCDYADKGGHLLGLFLKEWEQPAIQAIFAASKDERRARVYAQVARLKELNFEITPEEIFAKAGGQTVAKPHTADVLVDKGYFKDRDEVFDQLLGDGKPGAVGRSKLHLRDAINAVHGAGGKAFIAHPILENFSDAQLREMKSLGLDGIEINHPDQDATARLRYRKIAVELGLAISGGSDFHLTPRDALGKNGLTEAEWKELRAAIGV